METFATLLKQARLRCYNPRTKRSPLSQADLTEQLNAFTGLDYSRISYSNWENDINKIHHTDRSVLVGLIKVLHEHDGITNKAAADELLYAGDYRRLNDQETRSVNRNWPMFEPTKIFLPSSDEQAAMLPSDPNPLLDVDKTVDRLARLFLADQPTALVILIGVAGSGKTVLGTAVARRMITSNHYQRVVRVLLDSTHAQTNPMIALVDALAQEIVGQIEGNSRDKFLFVQNQLRQHRYFIVVDGLNSVDDAFCKQLSEWSQPSSFLVMSRIRPNSPAVVVEETPVWTLDDSMHFVRMLNQKYRGRNRPAMDEPQLKELCVTVGGHPKALQMIPGLSLRRTPVQLLSALKQGSQLKTLQEDMVSTAWNEIDADARKLLIAFCFVTESGASETLLRQVSGVTEKFWPALESLEQYALVIPHTTQTGWFYIHRLVSYFVIQSADPLLIAIANEVLSYWQARFKHMPQLDWHLLASELPNIFYAVQLSLQLRSETLLEPLASILPILYKFAEHGGHTQRLEPLLAESTQLPFSLSPLCHLTLLYGATQRLNANWTGAISSLNAAFEIALTLDDVHRQAEIQWQLASCFKGLNNLSEAERLASDAQQLFQAIDEPTGVGLAYNLLGLIAFERNDLSQASESLKQAIDLSQGVNQARAHNNLAIVLQQQQQYAAAIAQHTKARKLHKAHGRNLDLVTVTISEAILEIRLGKHSEADQLFSTVNIERVASIRMQAFYWWNWGQLALERQEWTQATERIQKSLRAWEVIGDENRLRRAQAALAQINAEEHRGIEPQKPL